MIRLYRAPFSTNAERVALALAHKGLEVESVVDLLRRPLAGRARQRPVARPGRRVRRRRGGASTRCRSCAVLEERSSRRAAVSGATSPARARAMRFIDWFNGVWKVAPNAIEAEIAARLSPTSRGSTRWPRRWRARSIASRRMLDGRAYLLGDEFSAADCAAYPFLKYAAWRDPADDELFHRVLDSYQQLGDDHPRLAAWIERIDERPRV